MTRSGKVLVFWYEEATFEGGRKREVECRSDLMNTKKQLSIPIPVLRKIEEEARRVRELKEMEHQ